MRVRELIDSAGIQTPPFFKKLQRKNAGVVAAGAPRAQHMQKRSTKALLMQARAVRLYFFKKKRRR